MTNTIKHPPSLKESSFDCPMCGVYAQQYASKITYCRFDDIRFMEEYTATLCSHCNKATVWYLDRVIYPDISVGPQPHPDLPADLIRDYQEASSILSRSPRGAAALLRLALQRLMPHVGEKGSNINDDIASLVKKGLPIEIQQSLDAVRVVGNEAVHPGELDLNDTPEIAIAMFDLLNFIVEDRIARPKRVATLYSKLPASKIAAIEKRDGLRST